MFPLRPALLPIIQERQTVIPVDFVAEKRS